MSLPSLHDTLRHLIRGSRFADEDQQRAALLSVDAHEHEFGTSDTEAYQAELDERAVAARREAHPDAPETDAERAARLEAENVQLRAQMGTAGGPRAPKA